MKSYTSIEQSKTLAEFLPLESADMRFCFSHTLSGRVTGHYPMIGREPSMGTIPCWSLAALHCVASTYCSRLEITLRADKKYNVFAVKDGFVFRSFDDHPDGFDNLVDACYEMVLKLHEQKLL